MITIKKTAFAVFGKLLLTALLLVATIVTAVLESSGDSGLLLTYILLVLLAISLVVTLCKLWHIKSYTATLDDNMLHIKEGVLDSSRRYDIEMKNMNFVRYNEQSGQYDQVQAKIPMMFVQKKFADSLTRDFLSVNGIYIYINAPHDDKMAVDKGYQLMNKYKTCLSTVTDQIVHDFLEK